MTAACNFISLGKRYEKNFDHLIGQKEDAKFACCVAPFLSEAE